MAKRKSNSQAKEAKKSKVQNVDENSSNSQDEEEYEVEKIIHHRKFSNGTVEYLVRWKGYGPDDDTWEKESNLTSSALIIAEYKDNLPDSDDEATNGNGTKNDDAEESDKEDDESTPAKKSNKSKKSTPKASAKSPKKAAKGRGRPKGKATKKVDLDDDDDEDGEERVEEFEVEKIIDVHTGKKGKKEYLVRWKGYSSKDDTWEPEAHLTCPDLIEAFNKKLDKIKGASEKSLRVAPAKTNRLSVQNSSPSGRHSKRNVGNRKSYAEDD